MSPSPSASLEYPTTQTGLCFKQDGPELGTMFCSVVETLGSRAGEKEVGGWVVYMGVVILASS